MGKRKDEGTSTHAKQPEQVAFGVVLHRHRTVREMTQEQLSWGTGVDRKYISRLEHGHMEPGLGTILKLVQALNVTLGAFMADVEEELTKQRLQARRARNIVRERERTTTEPGKANTTGRMSKK